MEGIVIYMPDFVINESLTMHPGHFYAYSN